MPKLPDATNLNGVQIGAPRSLVNIPVPDIAGAASAFARGVGQIGESISNIQDEQKKKAAAQERFNTKMGLLQAEEMFNERARDLDPLDPGYVEKKKTLYKEVMAPVLSNVRDPENRQLFDLSTYEGFVNLGSRAADEHKTARGKKAAIDISAYADGVRKRIRDKSYTGDPVADINQMLDDNQDIDQLTRETLRPELLKSINADQFEAEFAGVVGEGVSVTPSVRAAVAKAADGGPAWLEGYLLRAATIESAGGRKKVNPENPGVGGTWQIDVDTAPDLGLSAEDRFDDEKSAAGVAKMALRDFKMLQEALGRDPTMGELYLAHQQGIGAAPKLLANPDAKAADVVGLNAVRQNLPERLRSKADQITAGQFAELWTRKFDNSGPIDQAQTLETLRMSESYQRMSPDEQDAAEKDITARIEKMNKEAEKSAKISLQRSTVDYAVEQFEDRTEAESYVKKALAGDPEAREEALKMLTTQYNRIDEAEKVKYKTTVDDVWTKVNAALDAGDTDAARRAIPAEGLDRKDLDELNKAINDDGVKDDPKVLDGLTALKIGTEQERRYFANVDGQGLNVAALRGVLSREKLEALAKEQEAFRKQYETKEGKLPTYASAGEMLDLKLRGLGVDTSTKASPEDIRFKEAMRAMLARNTEAAVGRAGRDLTPTEMEDVLDQTFLEFREKGRPGFQIRAYGTPLFEIGGGGDTAFTARDVFDEFSSIEASHGVTPGEYLTRAQRALRAKGQNITPARLRAWLRAGVDTGVLKKNSSEAQ